MAMLRVKRPLNLDGLDEALPASCARGSHMAAASPADMEQALKRQRFITDAAHTAQQAGVPIGAGVRNSPFLARPLSRTDVERLVASSQAYSPSPKKADTEGDSERGAASVASSPRDQVAATPDKTAAGEKLYSKEELHNIINKVLKERESMLREEYNRILQAKLAEQFNSFTKFNQDYISRQIKGNPFSYVS